MSDLSTPIGDLPGIGAPAVRALAEQGFTTLGSLDGADWAHLSQLHGVGPAAGRRLQSALTEHGASLQNPPTPDTRKAHFSVGATGKVASDITTRPTEISPEDFLATLSERRTREGAALLELFRDATGEEPVMWGPTMIGYGSYHYRYASGREGDAFRVGFSPRTANIALYGVQDGPDAEVLLARLGKHKRGKACVWVNKLEDIDTAVLRELVEQAWATGPEGC